MEDDFIPDDYFIPDEPEMQGRIEKSGNLLERVIKNSRIGPFGGTSITAALPTSEQEAMDLGKVGIRQIIPEQVGLVGMGAKMVGAKGDMKLPPPQTDYGKNLESSANIAQLLHLGGSTIPAIGKGIKNIIKPFQTTPVKQSIEDLIFQGSKKVGSSVDDLFKQHNARFGEGMSNLQSSMSSDDFADIVSMTADELGKYDKSGETLVSELGRLLDESGKVYSPVDVQSKSKRIMQMLGNDIRAKAIFHKHFLDRIPESVPGLKELKSAHAPVYQTAKEAKVLNKGLMRKVASGKIGPEELSSAKSAQNKLGIDVLGPIEQKGNELQKIIMNKKIGKASLGLTGAGASILGIINALKGKN